MYRAKAQKENRMNTITVTTENIDDVRAHMSARDQAAELVVGCVTRGITHEHGQRGQLTVWPSGRFALCVGGDSVWGQQKVLQNFVFPIESLGLIADDGTLYSHDGEEIKEQYEEAQAEARMSASRDDFE